MVGQGYLPCTPYEVLRTVYTQEATNWPAGLDKVHSLVDLRCGTDEHFDRTPIEIATCCQRRVHGLVEVAYAILHRVRSA